MNKIDFDNAPNDDQTREHFFIIVAESLFVTFTEHFETTKEQFDLDTSLNLWNENLSNIFKSYIKTFSPKYFSLSKLVFYDDYKVSTKTHNVGLILGKANCAVIDTPEFLTEYDRYILAERIYNPYWINPFDNIVIKNKTYNSRRPNSI